MASHQKDPIINHTANLMASKPTQEIKQQIDLTIYENLIGLISAAEHNTLLNDIADSYVNLNDTGVISAVQIVYDNLPPSTLLATNVQDAITENNVRLDTHFQDLQTQIVDPDSLDELEQRNDNATVLANTVVFAGDADLNPVNVSIIQRADSAFEWSNFNPLLLNGELGVESDTHKMKLGDGENRWNTLDYFGSDLSTTDDLQEGVTNLYYTDVRVSDNVNVKQNTFDRHSHSNKIALDFITDDGSGNLFLTDDGTYKSTPGSTISTTDDLQEGVTNLYYTDIRVSNNVDVKQNTAKVGITTQQASDIANNNTKISYTDAAAVALNTAKVGITTQQASDITNNNTKISYTDAAAVALNTAKISADGSIGTHSDVDITTITPVLDDVLKFDGANWIPGTSSGGGGLTDAASGLTNNNGVAELGGTTSKSTIITAGSGQTFRIKHEDNNSELWFSSNSLFLQAASADYTKRAFISVKEVGNSEIFINTGYQFNIRTLVHAEHQMGFTGSSDGTVLTSNNEGTYPHYLNYNAFSSGNTTWDQRSGDYTLMPKKQITRFVDTYKTSIYSVTAATDTWSYHNNQILECDGAFAVNLNANNSGVDAGFSCTIVNIGAGTVTISATNLNAKGTLLESQWGSCTVYYDGTRWVAIGDLT